MIRVCSSEPILSHNKYGMYNNRARHTRTTLIFYYRYSEACEQEIASTPHRRRQLLSLYQSRMTMTKANAVVAYIHERKDASLSHRLLHITRALRTISKSSLQPHTEHAVSDMFQQLMLNNINRHTISEL